MANAGQRVGEYVLDAVIGRGAFGEVWRARHHMWTERIVAVKIPTDAAYLSDLQREGLAVPQLAHPGIVRALGFDPFAQPPYLAMEYVQGTSLRALISKRSLSIDDSIHILAHLLDALAHAHADGTVHRDVKPENILIADDAAAKGFATPGVVKLTDFGLGKSSRPSSTTSIAMSINPSSPAARELVGTIDYMSPEQRAGETVDGRTDLYACGVVLFEMLTGERPAGTEVPSDLNAGVPRWIDAVFRRAYARRDNRFVSATEFRAALRHANGSSNAPPLPVGQRRNAAAACCTRCNGSLARGDQFCIHCGLQVVAHVRRCAACGFHPSHDDRFCIRCGSQLNISPALA